MTTNLKYINKYKGKLYFTTLNYTSYYTLYPKIFEYTFWTLNYDSCYTLHPNYKFRVQNVIRDIVLSGKV